MSTVGIVCEYNPFHKGHEYQINKAKELSGAEHVVCFMSGNFVQRGLPAMADKYTRAGMALSCNADIVFEIPFVFATASARDYATAAVDMMNKLGIDYISFGAETDDLTLLYEISDIIENEPPFVSEGIKKYMSQGGSYGFARANAISDYLFGDSLANESADKLSAKKYSKEEMDAILKSPNNILAIEYICALKRSHSSIKPVPVTRSTSSYNSTSTENDLCSATAIRQLLDKAPDKNLARHVPLPVWDILKDSYGKTLPVFSDSLSQIFQAIRITDNGASYLNFNDIVDLDKDLVNRLSALPINLSYNEVIAALCCRNYTATHISRGLLHYILGLDMSTYSNFKNKGWIYYAKLLGFKREKSFIIGDMKKTADIPILTKTSKDIKALSPIGQIMHDYDIKAARLYSNLVYNTFGTDIGDDFSKTVVII